MEFEVYGTVNGETTNSTFSYLVTSASGGIYNVNATISSAAGPMTSTFVVDANNNTVLSYVVAGYSITGSEAKQSFDSTMGLFGLEEAYGGELSIFTSSSYFHSTGTTSMTFGTTTFPVTTYVANSLPETVSACGITTTITAYTLKVGTPTGTSLPFVTYLYFASTSPYTENVTFQLISMTVASS
jgi:hypothetical protein